MIWNYRRHTVAFAKTRVIHWPIIIEINNLLFCREKSMAATSDAEETSVEIDNETLMNCVQNYRCIYDKSCSGYRVLQKKRNAWKKISESLNLPVDVAQKRYNNIRTVQNIYFLFLLHCRRRKFI